MEEYVLKVGAGAKDAIGGWLELSKQPTHVRLATMAPLSNWGYPPGSEGALLKIGERGIVVGVEGNEEVPRDFVPWQNVSYLTDGTKFVAEQTKSG